MGVTEQADALCNGWKSSLQSGRNQNLALVLSNALSLFGAMLPFCVCLRIGVLPQSVVFLWFPFKATLRPLLEGPAFLFSQTGVD